MTLSKKEVAAFMAKHDVKNAEDVQEMTRNLLGGMYNLLLEGELTYQLGYKKHDQSNKKTSNSRNGYSKKEVNSKLGKTEIQVPRDRNGEFDPVVIKYA